MPGDEPMKKIYKIVNRVVREQLAPAQIVDLTVKEAEDADGDPILRIDVVFEAAEGRLDPKKVLGLIRNLRNPLADEGGSERFPVVYFTTADEASEAAA